ncbi:hypothetical protein TSUD_171790 [Trifolium subterraneum]|uniref:Uncharacterized protein n=1 Tax=Trifolium subterraneum TaxID=3900 RepID=A0A2Z6LJR0_TRISU|nr:hypothetical protein TSUD_171790 [Trifolium subterraneum]
MKKKLNTRRILEGSVAEARGEERQSATERRKGSGNFLTEEDLNLETPINCGVKGEDEEEDIGFDSIRVGSGFNDDDGYNYKKKRI